MRPFGKENKHDASPTQDCTARRRAALIRRQAEREPALKGASRRENKRRATPIDARTSDARQNNDTRRRR
eukprot:7451719-Lingulodinium_polyedra.AAC.1